MNWEERNRKREDREKIGKTTKKEKEATVTSHVPEED